MNIVDFDPDLQIQRIQEQGQYQPDIIIEDGTEDARWCTISVGALKKLMVDIYGRGRADQAEIIYTGGKW